jgi:hypothetical protein
MRPELAVRVMLNLDHPGTQALFGRVQSPVAPVRSGPLKDGMGIGNRLSPDYEHGNRSAADASGRQPVHERQVRLLAVFNALRSNAHLAFSQKWLSGTVISRGREYIRACYTRAEF